MQPATAAPVPPKPPVAAPWPPAPAAPEPLPPDERPPEVEPALPPLPAALNSDPPHAAVVMAKSATVTGRRRTPRDDRRRAKSTASYQESDSPSIRTRSAFPPPRGRARRPRATAHHSPSARDKRRAA